MKGNADMTERRDLKPLYKSIALHLVIVLVFFTSFDVTKTPTMPVKEVNIIQAKAVNQDKVQERINQLQKQRQDEERRKIQNQKQSERKLQELKNKRLAEQRRINQLKQKAKNEKQKLAKQKQQEEARLAKLKAERQKAQDKKKQEQERLAKLEEDRKKLEQERKKAEQQLAQVAKQKAAEEARRKAEEQKRKEIEQQLARLERQKKAEQERIAEQQRQAAEKARQQQLIAKANAEKAKYVTLIKQQIESNWLRPISTDEQLSCTIMVRLLPSGEVALAKITQSSGDAAFDDSALRAVYKSAPLPIPEDQIAFQQFRELILPFQPEA